MNNSSDYKTLLKNNIILIALIIFVIVYVIINLDIVKKGDIYNGDLTKTILLTSIIVLMIYLFVTWDEDDDNDIVKADDIKNIQDLPIAKFNLGSVNKPIAPLGQIEQIPQTQTINKVIANNPTMNELGPAQTNQIQDKILINKPGEMKTRIVNIPNPISNPVSNPIIELNKVKNNIDKYDNPNIFISQKNIGKYGIKF